MNNITLNQLKQYKHTGEKFAVITAYDATFAQLIDQSNIECILVGDSLGNVIQGQKSTVPVTMEHMVYHTQCVSRGCDNSFIMSDMPYMSYATPEQAMSNATQLMQAGAHMVKLEGSAWLYDTIRLLSERGVPVCAHLGLLPQSVDKSGGYRVQGKNDDDALQLMDDALALVEAGADILLFECIPEALAASITQAVSVPVIGIGAGASTDAQVLVLHDLLGMSARTPKFVKNFMQDADSIQEALSNYANDVKQGRFPSEPYILA